MPNAGRGLVRHKYRTEEWDPAFREYLKSLDAKKPVVMCGDLNVAHQEIGKPKILFILWTHLTHDTQLCVSMLYLLLRCLLGVYYC